MDVGVLVEGCVVGGDDGIPYDRFGGRDCAWRGGGIGGGDVEEDLFGIPVEEGCKI